MSDLIYNFGFWGNGDHINNLVSGLKDIRVGDVLYNGAGEIKKGIQILSSTNLSDIEINIVNCTADNITSTKKVISKDKLKEIIFKRRLQ